MIRTFFTVIGAIKALNISCGKIEFDKERLDYYLLKEQSQSARAIYKLEHIDPELFVIASIVESFTIICLAFGFVFRPDMEFSRYSSNSFAYLANVSLSNILKGDNA